jgi:hypothetical protein
MTRDLAKNARFRSILALVISAALILGTAAEAAVGVRTNRKLAEVTPAADVVGGKRFVGWAQGARGTPKTIKALVKRGGRKPIRLNRRGTDGFMGGIDGQVAVYQERGRRDSDIFRFNLRTGDRAGITPNSGKHEYAPTISGNFILFGRNARRDTVVLFNRKTGDSRILASAKKVGGGTPRLEPGQVNGDFAVFHRCTVGITSCDVIRYQISTRNFVTIPSKRPFQYNASVMPNGSVYFAGSGKACGANTGIYRRRNGTTTRIGRLRRNYEVFLNTFAAPKPGGGTDVYYTRGRCKNDNEFENRANFDIVRVNG